MSGRVRFQNEARAQLCNGKNFKWPRTTHKTKLQTTVIYEVKCYLASAHLNNWLNVSYVLKINGKIKIHVHTDTFSVNYQLQVI